MKLLANILKSEDFSLSLIYKHNKVLVYDEKPESWAVSISHIPKSQPQGAVWRPLLTQAWL